MARGRARVAISRQAAKQTPWSTSATTSTVNPRHGLTVLRSATLHDLEKLFAVEHHRRSYAGRWADDIHPSALPFGYVVRDQNPLAAARRG
jgi:hypothetical protein